jgi:hypothetical protein
MPSKLGNGSLGHLSFPYHWLGFVPFRFHSVHRQHTMLAYTLPPRPRTRASERERDRLSPPSTHLNPNALPRPASAHSLQSQSQSQSHARSHLASGPAYSTRSRSPPDRRSRGVGQSTSPVRGPAHKKTGFKIPSSTAPITAVTIPKDIHTTLSYQLTLTSEPPYQYIREPPPGVARHNLGHDMREVIVKDMRGSEHVRSHQSYIFFRVDIFNS